MRRFVIGTCLIGSSLLVLQAHGVQDSLLLFFMAGILPGTSIRISSAIMLFAFSVVAIIIISSIVAHRISVNRLAQQYMKTANRLPKRRYGHA